MIEITTKFWEEIYHQNIKKMIGVCYRYTHDSQLSEDLAHDAFIVAYQKASSFEGKGPFEAWLRRIVVNVCLQHIRKKSKEKYLNDFLSNETVEMETNDENLTNEQFDFTYDELLEAVNQLPEHHKLVFNLYVIDNFSHIQIANELGISEGTSKSHLARARKKIKLILIEKYNSQKKKRTFLLFGLPLKLWNIDGLYRNRFRKFEIQNYKHFSFDKFRTDGIQISSAKAPFLGNLLYPTITLIGVGVSLLINLNIKTTDVTSSENTKVKVFESGGKIFQKIQDSTATNLKNGIIVKENKFLTIKNDTMKNRKALAAVLLAGATLANIEGQTIKNDSAISDSKVLITDNKYITIGQPKTANLKTISDNNSAGTFYAKSIWWSDDNKLYFNGKVIVDIGQNKFIGNGSFDMFGKVYYIVVEGKPMKLGSKINLDEAKKYKLTQISANNAVVKYGEAGKQGVVEIELAN